ncbi:MAG: hypothetical protein ACK4NP_15250, partial [Parvularculaceae bacterium]
PIAAALDGGVIEALDLYRHGLSFARRRLETLVRFSDRAALIIGGDPSLAPEAAAAMSAADADRFRDFLERALDDARRLAPWFAGEERATAPSADDIAASLDQRLAGRFADPRLEDWLRAEALLRAAVRPTEPYGWLALLHRLSGDAAGLQAGLAAIEGGERALLAALRRACQALGVAFRQTDRIAGVVVEWDRVEGLALDDGGQIRAPAVVSTASARETFLGLVSRARLDIEFANFADAPGARLASARVHVALDRAPADEVAAARPDRRFLLAPGALETHQAFRAAGDGAAAGVLIAEAMIPSAIDPALAPDGGATISMLLHPVGRHALDDAAARKAIAAAATGVLDRLMPGASAAASAIDIEPLSPAAAPIAICVERRRLFTEASGVDGLFFCGPEVQPGARLTLGAGRRAAERALTYVRQRSGR